MLGIVGFFLFLREGGRKGKATRIERIFMIISMSRILLEIITSGEFQLENNCDICSMIQELSLKIKYGKELCYTVSLKNRNPK